MPPEDADLTPPSLAPTLRALLLSLLPGDLTLQCSDGPLTTSSLLLSSISPWIASLLKEAGREGCLFLPSLSTTDLFSYIDHCLSSGLPDVSTIKEVQELHLLLAPKILPYYDSSKEFEDKRTIRASQMLSDEKPGMKDHDSQSSDEEGGEVKKETINPTTEEVVTNFFLQYW